jgi:hypothetical protein
VSGGDDAQIDGSLLGVADGENGPLLQDAQQLGLRLQRQLSHLVEEQRAAGGRDDQALAGLRGAGERPALVPEELGLQERLGDRGAVDRHEGAGAPAPGVQLAREQLLARPALAVPGALEDRRDQGRHPAVVLDQDDRAAGGVDASRGCHPSSLCPPPGPGHWARADPTAPRPPSPPAG